MPGARALKVVEDAEAAANRWFRSATSRSDDLAELERLVAAGQRLEARKQGSTALHLTVGRGRVPAVAWLLARGADQRSRTAAGGWTPLHLAASRVAQGGQSAAELVLALLAHGAPPLARDASGRTALALARAGPSALPAALEERLERAEHLRRRWRLFCTIAGVVAPWHARAREVAYAPGGRVASTRCAPTSRSARGRRLDVDVDRRAASRAREVTCVDLLHTQKRAASLSPHDMHMHMCMYCTTTWVLCVYRCSVSRVAAVPRSVPAPVPAS